MSKLETIHIVVPATYKNLRFIGSCVRSLLRDISELKNQAEGSAEEVSSDVELAVHEVCNNIIEHAYGHENGRITADFGYDADQNVIVIDLYDTGKPFAETDVVLPNLEVPQEGGYGLFLANQLLDEVTYNRNAGKNHWHLVKYL